MISFDTNLLLYSLNQDCAECNDARAFFASLPTAPGAVVICELVLVELYVLLRNPAVLRIRSPQRTPCRSSSTSVDIPLGRCRIIRATPRP